MIGEGACIHERLHLRMRRRQRRSLRRHEQRRNLLASQEWNSTCRIHWRPPAGHIIRHISRPALSLGDRRLLLHLRTRITGALYA